MPETNTTIGLKDGDRIVFFGDSITRNGALPNGYITLIEEQVRKHHPHAKIELIGAGIGGDRVHDLQKRVDRDVISQKPTIAVIYIGINDVWYAENDPNFLTRPTVFKARLEDVTGRIAKTGATIVLCTLSVIGEQKVGTNPFDEHLDDLNKVIRGVARQHNYVLCDLRKGFADYLATHNQDNASSGIVTIDKVHLNDEGNLLVSKLLLKTLGETK